MAYIWIDQSRKSLNQSRQIFDPCKICISTVHGGHLGADNIAGLDGSNRHDDIL